MHTIYSPRSPISNLFVFFLATFSSGCFSTLPADRSEAVIQQSYLASGSISLVRPISSSKITSDSSSLFSFMPVQNMPASNQNRTVQSLWIIIDRSKSILSLVDADQNIATVPASISANVTPGTYSLLLKQKSPLWYAPDEYFTSRNQVVPLDGSSDRFRRGALGDEALFLSSNVVIHSGPVSDKSITGIRVDPAEMSRFYSMLPDDIRIIIRS